MTERLAQPTDIEIISTAVKTRADFMDWRIDQDLLADLYNEYHPITNIRGFLNHARTSFPEACCGLATVYLMHKLHSGKIVRGTYDGEDHTFLKFPDKRILDITADQFGGPEVYFDALVLPWSSRPSPVTMYQGFEIGYNPEWP